MQHRRVYFIVQARPLLKQEWLWCVFWLDAKRLELWWIIKSDALMCGFSGIANCGLSWDWNSKEQKLVDWQEDSNSCSKHVAIEGISMCDCMFPQLLYHVLFHQSVVCLTGWLNFQNRETDLYQELVFPYPSSLKSQNLFVCVNNVTSTSNIWSSSGAFDLSHRLEQPPAQAHYWWD